MKAAARTALGVDPELMADVVGASRAASIGIGLQGFSPAVLADMKAAARTALGVDPALIADVVAASTAASIGIGPALKAQLNAMEDVRLSVMPLIESIRHMVDSQQMASSLVGVFAEISQASMSHGGVEILLANNNALIASSLASINRLGILSEFNSTKLDALLYGGVSEHILNVTRSFEGLYRPETARARPAVVESESPAITTSSYASSLSLSLDPKSEPVPGRVDSIVDRLDEHLAGLDPVFVKMRKGAWEALETSNPERCRHAAISYRELFRRVLQRLAPDARMDAPVPGSKIRGRVREILGGSDSSAGFVVAVSGAAFALYDFLSKPTHADFNNREAVRGALMTGEGLLLFIFEECAE
jgi:hypothetical protein